MSKETALVPIIELTIKKQGKSNLTFYPLFVFLSFRLLQNCLNKQKHQGLKVTHSNCVFSLKDIQPAAKFTKIRPKRLFIICLLKLMPSVEKGGVMKNSCP